MELSVNDIVKALDAVMPKRTVTAKNYVNPLAAMLLEQAGYQVKLRDGTVWKNEYDTNYGFAEFTRARHLQGQEAKETLTLINDKSSFLQRYNKLSGDTPIIPMDYWSGIPEQLTDTQRITTNPQDNANVEATRNKWAAMFGEEIYVPHLERQVDLPIEVIRQYLYDPDFEARVEKLFTTEMANDLTRLAVKGTDVSYAGQDFYKLLKGYFQILKEAKGTKTLVSGVNRFVGKFGKLVTPVKINAPAIRFIDPFSDAFDADTAASYTASAGALAVSSGKMDWTGTAWTGGSFRYNNIIPVLMNTEYVASVKLKGASGSTGQITIKDPAGNTIAVSNQYALNASNYTTVSVRFNSYNNLGISLTVTCVQGSADTDFVVDDISVVRAINKFEFYDILDIMDKMIDNYNQEYDKTGENLAFLMSQEDADMVEKGLRLPIYVAPNNQIFPNPTEAREGRLLAERPNLPYRGYPIKVVPYALPLNEGGYIIFGADEAEFRIAFQNIFNSIREYKPRMKSGGEGYEYTYHMYQSYGVRNPGKFVIAEGIGSSLKCEDLIVSSSKDLTGTRIGSGSSVTIDKSDLATAGHQAYVFCDTPNTELFYSATAANLATYDLAVTQTNAKDVDFSALTNGTYYVRAFLDGVTLPSDILTLTVQD